MKREFTYKGIKFHLNTNGLPNDPRREIEGRYILLYWNDGYERWQALTTTDTKAEAMEYLKTIYRKHWHPFY